MHPEHRSIGELAYRLWQARGCPEGTAERDWLDAEKQLKGAQRAIEPRATVSRASESTTSNAIDSSLKATFPASDPPASQRADEPPANADAKWKAAASRKAPAVARARQPKSTQGKPGAKPPG
jgi:hypothetical protein